LVERNLRNGFSKGFAVSPNVFERRIGINKNRKFVKNIRLALIFAICFALSGCQDAPKIIRVDSIDRNTFAALYEKPNQILLVEIDENGRLKLNKIETGTISDVSILSEKIKVIFDDREKAGINEREIVIDPQGNVKSEDLGKLIESLAVLKAAPIRIIKNNL